ncbi:HNH endonuclease, partial [Rhodococcus spelaei]|uniref:HNH endonuclease n=1 Tax=Rhodococcus spelaei TaxID=2546320 RepID=UPI0015EFBB89
LLDFATDTLEDLYNKYGNYRTHHDEDEDAREDYQAARRDDSNTVARQRDSGLTVCRSRVLPAGAQPRRSRPDPLHTPRLRAAHLDALRRQLTTNPDSVRALFPDGHGGFTEPPPGALTYRPNTTLAAAIRLRDGHCRHPGCTVPADRCQIDHIVPFDHTRPWLGGWTIATNLQCLCVLHHQLKTAGHWHYDMLTDAVIHAHNTIGQHDITLPILRRRYG